MSIQIVIFASIGFFLSELVLVIAKRSKGSETKIKKDKSSLLLFWITIPLALTAGFFLAKYGEWSTLNKSMFILGLSLFLMGMLIRWISIIQLKKEFTVDVSLAKNHQLKMDGMYKHLRHPSYSGLLLTCFGLSLAMNSLISLVVITLPITLVLMYRIKVEEDMLINEFGEDYVNYKKKTRKIFPRFYSPE